ncbi:MAG TPA: nitrite/sulfite reductase [Solirubrobacteraceae bacterium]|jgi:sulfite reductase beta subunit-like hemoprotein
MEPVSLPTAKGTPPKGSLDDPEVIQHVPGHVIPILQREYDDFKTEATRFLDNQLEEDTFIKFRLKQGVYGQRQPDVQMVRTKVPFGGITPAQMDKFGDVVELYAPLKKGHITTRQNIQMHHIPLLEAEKAIRMLGEAGLSSREGCGNTMRNVTGDPWAGVASDELFDLTPYAAAYVRYFVRHPTTQGMPRKVKTSFDASSAGRAISEIHDIAFIARERDGVKGVEMLVGGGTAIMPRTAKLIYDFVELDNGEYLKKAEAVLRIFDRQEWLRANRARARIKVFVDKYGIDELRAQADEELKGDWVAERDFSIDGLIYENDEQADAPPVPVSYGSPNGDLSEFERFMSSNATEQRQEGFVAIEVKIPRGDLSPEQFRGLAAIMRQHTGGYARTTVQQNIVLRWIRKESAYDVWSALQELGLGGAGSRELGDIVSCPGTDSCKLGITSSMGLNSAIEEKVASLGITDPLVRQVHIKISGCPNGCGQHHLGAIGFTGASIKVGSHTIPAYIPHVMGVFEGGEVKFGQRLKLRLPAKRVPEAVARWLKHYESNHNDGETWIEFVQRVGTPELEGLVKELSLPMDFGIETMNEFIDWNRNAPFEVIRGEGECAI